MVSIWKQMPIWLWVRWGQADILLSPPTPAPFLPYNHQMLCSGSETWEILGNWIHFSVRQLLQGAPGHCHGYMIPNHQALARASSQMLKKNKIIPLYVRRFDIALGEDLWQGIRVYFLWVLLWVWFCFHLPGQAVHRVHPASSINSQTRWLSLPVIFMFYGWDW